MKNQVAKRRGAIGPGVQCANHTMLSTSTPSAASSMASRTAALRAAASTAAASSTTAPPGKSSGSMRPPGNTHAPPAKASFELRRSMSVSSPSGASRSRTTVAAGMGGAGGASVTRPTLSGPGESCLRRRPPRVEVTAACGGDRRGWRSTGGTVTPVEYRLLGASGITVSTQCLGTMMLGVGGNDDADECVRMVHTATRRGRELLRRGRRLFARRVGGDPRSGARRAARRRDRRHQVLHADGNRPQPFGRLAPLDRAGGGGESAAPRYRLHRLYQMHRPDPHASTSRSRWGHCRTSCTRARCAPSARARFAAHEIVQAQWAAERRNTERFRTEQPPYSLFVRRNERDVFPVCLRYGMGVLVYAPLNSGWLSGRYTRDAPPPEGTAPPATGAAPTAGIVRMPRCR